MQGRGVGRKLKVGGGHILQSEFPCWTLNLPLELGGQKQKEIPPFHASYCQLSDLFPVKKFLISFEFSFSVVENNQIF